MSKSIGKILGAGTNNTKGFGSEAEYLQYLKNYNTSNVDSAYNNLAQTANKLSSNLSERPNYIYSVDGSDDARKRMEQTIYDQSVSALESEYGSRKKELETRLQNQGFSPQSEAYQNAMAGLEAAQSSGYVDAAQKSVAAGQEAYSNSLSDQINAASFQNNARQLPLNEIANMLQNQYSGYDIASTIYGVASGRDNRINNAKNQNAADQYTLGNQVLMNGAKLLFSDKELKEQIICVGRLHNGLPVYLFTYKGDTAPRLGLLAQEVLAVHPEAVAIDKSGYFKVDYALACR